MWLSSNWSGSAARSRVSRKRGITALDSRDISMLLSRATADGCCNLASGWQTRRDGTACLRLFRTLRVGLGERCRLLDGGVAFKIGLFK